MIVSFLRVIAEGNATSLCYNGRLFYQRCTEFFLFNPAGLTGQKFMAERPGKNTGLPDC